jgi:hypothetical protein
VPEAVVISNEGISKRGHYPTSAARTQVRHDLRVNSEGRNERANIVFKPYARRHINSGSVVRRMGKNDGGPEAGEGVSIKSNRSLAEAFKLFGLMT